ncbi:hypothetical protein DQ239_17945 [Blastococcus sp. TF02-09]|uniref:DUF5946 family protein n=1 Tax=Blastococcus sp. TF02-09 TaxID=2250576 RepID=UPI000DE88CBB|nr:DUF5946 family protein [Blastococcus sp. TF02-9]RBY74917.1 hypothetical protein DQ239_17945 [Blastococcus sp. TF02-9]
MSTPPLPDPATEVCPGCGAVLAPVPTGAPPRSGASPSCARLFDVTLRGPHEEASADAGAAATARLADAAYAAQHPVPGDPSSVSAALDLLESELGGSAARRSGPPPVWTTTIADVAADLDVIDLGVLVESWARAVLGDWHAPAEAPRGALRP